MLTAQLEKSLDEHAANDLSRKRFIIASRDDNRLNVDGNEVLNFCSNDYLGLASHPKVKTAFKKAAAIYGLGSGSSNLISGYFKSQSLLEEAFCKFLNRERAVLFNSGYHANLGVLTAFAKRNAVVIADKFCHASLIDGILLSRAKHYRYRHNDIQHAETLLRRPTGQRKLLVTESVFSMEGNISNIKHFAELAERHQAMLVVDDAHGIGILGKTGKGICEYYHLSQQAVQCLITPLGKALGSFGAIVSGSEAVIETLLQFAKTYCYTTALPPAISSATLAALKIITDETWRREKLTYLSILFNHAAADRDLKFISSDPTPIKSIVVGSNKIALHIQKQLLQQGFFVSCIRPPSVSVNAARIKISLNCMQSEAQIYQLLDLLKNCQMKIHA